MVAKTEDLKFPTRIRRTRPKVHSDLVRNHARHTGEIVFAWNDLQAALFSVFAALVGGTEKQGVAYGIWHTVRSDKTQREMLFEAAKPGLRESPELFDALKWVLDRASDLSGYRNDAAHTNMWFVRQSGLAAAAPRIMLPDLESSRKATAERLLDQPTAGVWRAVRGDLYALAQYARIITTAIRFPGLKLKAFPARPRLQAVQQKPKRGGRPSHPQGSQRRASPPQS